MRLGWGRWGERETAHTLSHLAYWISEKLCPSPTPRQPRPLFKAELSLGWL